VGGTVTEVNAALEDTPETVNLDPYGDGWFFKVRPDDVADLEDLLSADGYRQACEADAH
jgi:glycine cleavage system H protein